MVTVGALMSPVPLFAALPTVSTVSPTTVSSNTPVMLTATVGSSSGFQYCKLYVDLEEIGTMTVVGNTASKSFTFTSGGSHIAFAYCRDNNNQVNSGANTAIWVNGAITPYVPFSGGNNVTPTPPPAPIAVTTTVTTVPAPTPTSGSLIKLACAENAKSDDPCRAVYYRGADGKRHAFPNSKVYFTWYQNFDSVVTVSAAEMGNSLLGKNITYRPGVKMVKFETLNRVYAVAQGGLLRWVTSESIASSLYGSDWNSKIDDISDTFYGNYTFGTDITEGSPYSAATELNTGANIESSF